MAVAPLSYTVAAPSRVADAYKTAASLAEADTGGFGAMLGRAMGGAVTAGEQADTAAAAAINGTGSVTQVVTALSRAELALQTTSTVRDKMVQAYQDIMRMPI